jgi:ATP-dependent DNA ligase
LLYVDHAEDGQGLFDLVCANDLEGVVAKPKTSEYADNRWVKFLNTAYSLKQDRDKVFERK